ncbi:Wzz/FepE/Etk N-terminal domain-containing protein [Flavobacteriaceae bacterium]|nr:Wzz/FepE/Etk N-terminal domain-containing protein [Flavobacteriaceae bacterium]
MEVGNYSNPQSEDEIDIIALIKTIWKKRMWIVKGTVVSMILGLFVALLTPNTYTASSLFVPNSSSSGVSSSGLNGLASLAGINLNSGGGGEISPTIYPKILESAKFKQQILNISLPQEQDEVTFRDYSLNGPKSFISLLKKYTIGLPGVLINLFKGEAENALNASGEQDYMKISKEDSELFEDLEEIININFNEKEYYIELSVTLDDPNLSAFIAVEAEKLLQKEIIKIKIKQSIELLEYIEERYNIQKQIMYSAQNDLADFKDRNVAISSASFENKLTRLEQEYRNANTVFQEVAKQREQIKLQVSQDTPVFSVIKPVVVPNEKSGPKRALILIVWTFLGFALTSGYVLVEEPLKSIIKEIRG